MTQAHRDPFHGQPVVLFVGGADFENTIGNSYTTGHTVNASCELESAHLWQVVVRNDGKDWKQKASHNTEYR